MTYMSSTVADHFELPEGRRHNGSLVGVEIEVEAHNSLPTSDTVLWSNVEDHSLRGNSREYVLKTPMTPSDAKSAVSKLYTRFNRNNVDLKNSMRAGVHIHLNQQHKTIQQLMTFVTAYWIFEDYLVEKYCGEERAGNLFCLRLSDAESPLMHLVSCLRSQERIVHQEDDIIRYSGLNLCSLPRFGTVEFRALRTPTTAAPVNSWIDTLTHLESAAQQFNSPLDLVEAFSGEGPQHLAERLLVNAERLNEEQLYRSLRRVQPLIYLVNWEAL